MDTYLQTNFTYNLNVLISNSKNILVHSPELLDQIKYEITNIEVNDRNLHHVKWYQVYVKKPQSYFMGDLFTSTNYDYNYVYNCVKSMLDKIEEKIKRENVLFTNWKIIFHVYRL
jgi:hypothetical protein